MPPISEDVTTKVDVAGPAPDLPKPPPPSACDHDGSILANVDVVPLMDSPGRMVADVTIKCTRCNRPFEFVGLPFGNDLGGATRATADGTVARIAIAPKGAALPPFRDAVAKTFFVRPQGWKP